MFLQHERGSRLPSWTDAAIVQRLDRWAPRHRQRFDEGINRAVQGLRLRIRCPVNIVNRPLRSCSWLLLPMLNSWSTRLLWPD